MVTETKEVIGWRVRADHPIFARPDVVECGENAEASARSFAEMLRKQGFENIEVVPEVMK